MTYNAFSGTLNPTQSINHFDHGYYIIIAMCIRMCDCRLIGWGQIRRGVTVTPLTHWWNWTLSQFCRHLDFYGAFLLNFTCCSSCCVQTWHFKLFRLITKDRDRPAFTCASRPTFDFHCHLLAMGTATKIACVLQKINLSLRVLVCKLPHWLHFIVLYWDWVALGKELRLTVINVLIINTVQAVV